MQSIILGFYAFLGLIKHGLKKRGRGKRTKAKNRDFIMLRHEDDITKKKDSRMSRHDFVMLRHEEHHSKTQE